MPSIVEKKQATIKTVATRLLPYISVRIPIGRRAADPSKAGMDTSRAS